MKMLKLTALALLGAGTAVAAEGPVPTGVPRLDHVFVVMMENHGYSQIIGNPNAPFVNEYARRANLATNYFAVAHPSLTNYLEVTGGSNFGVLNDNAPDWHDASCAPNLATGQTSLDNGSNALAGEPICPISGKGTDAATPAIDCSNEVSAPPCENNIDGMRSIPASSNIVGKTIADQLVAAGRRWKSYQENLPLGGADNVNFSDGEYSNLTDFASILPQLNPPLSTGDVVQLYAAKHDPFVYFRSVQESERPHLGLAEVVPFDGPRGLYADLASGRVPDYSFIVPNQCNDQHGRGNAGPFCNFDPTDDGTQAGLNPALIQLGDNAIRRLVDAIHGSPTWEEGRSVIVVTWDENDYSAAPNINKVVTIVETSYGRSGVQSDTYYNHYSLLRTIEAGFGLPCLNHACDRGVDVMSDLFR
ncbi:MAG TPA: alkaline phosphatase family protein [Myxococcales bacterium]|nr:alkaline phosphatase family protein [Myxococcales bacterium]